MEICALIWTQSYMFVNSIFAELLIGEVTARLAHSVAQAFLAALAVAQVCYLAQKSCAYGRPIIIQTCS